MVGFDRRNFISGGAALVMASGLQARSVQLAKRHPLTQKFAGTARIALAGKAAPGMTIALAERGAIIYSAAAGSANLETNTPVSLDSVFRIGSLSKQFTAAAALKLAEQGRLDLDAPIERTLPAFRNKPIFSLREAMHHSAGLHSDEEGDGLQTNGQPITQIRLANAIASQTKLLDFQPGTAWLYSNANYIVLGAAIEVATQQPFDAAMRELLFRPLGLSATSVDRDEQIVPHRVSGYSALDGGPVQWANAIFPDIFQAGGAGAMRSTAGDLIRWHQAVLGSKYFAATTREAILAPGRLRDGRLVGDNRFSSEDARYGDVQYAGGLLVPPPGKPRTITHNGFIGGFSALLETHLGSGRTLVVLLNADPGPNLPFRDLRRTAFD